MENTGPKPIFSNRTYDVLKFVAQILIPAIGTLYFALAQIWGLPYGNETVGTLAAVDTFLGVILGLSSTAYSKTADGVIDVHETDEKKAFQLSLFSDPDLLDQKKEVRFKVNRQ